MDLFLASKVVAGLILPPAGPLILGIFGLLILRYRRRFGLLMMAASICLSTLFSLPVVATLLIESLEIYPALGALQVAAQKADAIVILGGGRYRRAAEYGGNDTLSEAPLMRVRYGARLHREMGLPILVSGGTVLPEETEPEAALMAAVLRNEFQVPVQWLEDKSRNTAENASFSARILHPANLRHVILVTHGTHMRRSVRQFARAGFDVTPAPTRLSPWTAADGFGWGDFVPQAWAARSTYEALHEYLGMLWYLIKYR